MLSMKAIKEGGSASRAKIVSSLKDGGSNGMTSLFPNFRVMNREHKDRPVQTQKRTTKLNWLIMSIPKYGPRAKAILKDK